MIGPYPLAQAVRQGLESGSSPQDPWRAIPQTASEMDTNIQIWKGRCRRNIGRLSGTWDGEFRGRVHVDAVFEEIPLVRPIANPRALPAPVNLLKVLAVLNEGKVSAGCCWFDRMLSVAANAGIKTSAEPDRLLNRDRNARRRSCRVYHSCGIVFHPSPHPFKLISAGRAWSTARGSNQVKMVSGLL